MKKPLDLNKADYYGKFKYTVDLPLAVSNIIQMFNYFDITVNKLLTRYFNPQNRADDFERIFLNSSIVSIGQKIKVLNNLKNFDSKIISQCQRISSVRNGVAHSSPHEMYHLTEKLTKAERRYVIDVMNSSGVIKTKNFETEYEEFLLHHSEIMEYLKIYIDKITG